MHFGNYMFWGAKCEICFGDPTQAGYHLHLGVEHRLRGAALRVAKRQRRKAGWKAYTCPAEETAAGSTSGAAWIMGHLSNILPLSL